MEAHQFLSCSGVKTALEGAATAAAAAAFVNAHVVNAYVSQQQAQLLISLFQPVQLRFEPSVTWSHPIQRVIHNYFEAYVRKKAGKCLEVGAHPRSINDNPDVQHRCFLRPVGRDKQRWCSAPRRGPANNIRRSIMQDKKPLDVSYCLSGFEACDFQSETGIALYSLHDFDPVDVAKAMKKHGMLQLYAVLHLPVESLLPIGTYKTSTYTVYNTEDRIIVTYAGDSSAGYNHCRKKIRRWLKTTNVGGCNPLIIERVRAMGAHFVLLITATEEISPMPYTPFPRSDLIYVRSLFGAAGQPAIFDAICCESQRSTFHSVPESIWQRLMLFGLTLDDGAFCCSRLMTYLRGISHKVTVGDLVANEGWDADEMSLTAVVVAAYLTICHNRWIRTQGISKGIKRLEVEHAQGKLTRLYSWLCEKLGCSKKGFIPGRQLAFYKLCSDWVSAGCYVRPSSLMFDQTRFCEHARRGRLKRLCCKALELSASCGCYLKSLCCGAASDTSDSSSDLEPISPILSPLTVPVRSKVERRDVQSPAPESNHTSSVNLSGEAIKMRPLKMRAITPPAPSRPPSWYLDEPDLDWVETSASIKSKFSYIPYSPKTLRELARELFRFQYRIQSKYEAIKDGTLYLPRVRVLLEEARLRPRFYLEMFFSPFFFSFRRSVVILNPFVSKEEDLFTLPSQDSRLQFAATPDGASQAPESPDYVVHRASDRSPTPSIGRCSLSIDTTSLLSYAGALPTPPVFTTRAPSGVFKPVPQPRSLKGTPPPVPPRRNPPVDKPKATRVLLRSYSDGSCVYEGSLFDSNCTWLVNAANRDHVPGGGICGIFHSKFPSCFDVSKAIMKVGDCVYMDSPRKIIHAVAPDYRRRKDRQGVFSAYADTLHRLGTAAYPLLGTGIFQVPFSVSIAAWERYHRPGDELYLLGPAAAWFKSQYVSHDYSTLNVTKAMVSLSDLAFAVEKGGAFDKFLPKDKVKMGPIKYRYIAGVPGSGKSTGISKNDCDMVVVPTNNLREDWQNRGFKVKTPHVALNLCKGLDVIVDEAPALAPHHLLYIMSHAASVLLLGDPNQIPALDFEGRGIVGALNLSLTPTEYRRVTHRCPRDVCAYLKADYPGITTTSSVVRSVVFNERPQGQLIVFTQAAKAIHKGSITVHEAQGATFDYTTLIATADSKGLIMQSRAHCIVALTRHREKCVVVDCAGMLRDVGVSEAVFSNFYLTKPFPRPAVPAKVPRGDIPVNNDDLDGIPEGYMDVALYQLSEHLGHRPTDVAAVVPPCPELEQGKLYLPFKMDTKDEIVVLRLSDTVHCRMAAPTDRAAVMATLVGRYGKKTKCWKGPTETVRDRLKRWIPTLDPVSFTEVELGELVDAMQARGQDGTAVVDLVLSDRDATRITFFQKDCNKFTTGETIAHGRVGQGISAWSKTTVALFGPLFRAIEKQIKDRLPPSVFFEDLYDESVLSAAVAASPGLKVFENDFSEFDSTQNDFSLSLECLLMEEAGAPDWLVTLYHLIRSSWVLQAPQESLKGKWKKHSGEPGTLLFNTVWNMAVIAYCFDFQDLSCCGFKGDDSFVCCSSFSLRQEASDMIAGCGLKLKQQFRAIGSYAGVIIAPGVGVVPDVVRFAGRLTEKNWGGKEGRSDELRQAVHDFLEKTRNTVHIVIEVCAMYYGCERNLVFNLLAGLKAVVKNKMMLVELVLPVLRLFRGIKE
uniref:Non-structural polyprotein n=1 Tax=Hepevirus sp. TaxID=2055261 RepID=A0A2H4RDP9_9VIRU|nr:non-structural polyprotein [Hepevirus sp.]